MGQLLELQRELKSHLFIGRKASVPSRFWKDGAPERLRVYRNNVHLNWIETLESDFPLTKKQFDEAAWRSLAERYFTQHPPKHWELNTSVAPFVTFMKKQKVAPHVKELADFEWADMTAFMHTATPTSKMGVTNPTFDARVYQHQMFFWVKDKAPANKPPAGKPEVLIFFRDSQHRVCIEEADPITLLMLEHFRKPGAELDDLEPVRQQLLPGNKVPLNAVLKGLIQKELIYL